MKGRINITDFDTMPFYMMHSIYYEYWLYAKEQANKPPEQQGAEALTQALEDSM